MPAVPDGTLKTELASLGPGPVVALVVGNPDRGDDAAGPVLAGLLAGRSALPCIVAGGVPENHLEEVVRSDPGAVLVVDAADFSGEPGEARLLSPADLAAGGISTHAGSLEMVCNYLAQRSGATVRILGIQAVSLDHDAAMDPRVAAGVERLANLLTEVYPLG